MVVIRFNSFVLVLLFIFYHVRGSIAQTYDQAMEKTVVVMDKKIHRYQSEITKNEIYENIAMAAEVKKTKLGGRKMMLIMESEEGLDGRRQVWEFPGATHLVGNKYNNNQGKENKLGTKGNLDPVKGQKPSHIPINADYQYVPRPHPPKNN